MTTQNSAPRPPRALIAMSGGVDSSVAAWLMQRDGYDCTGITMRLTHNEMLGQSGFHTCCSEKDIEDAAEVAFALDIPYEVLDFTADFREQIIEKFVRVYEAGGTPNPCIDCNKYMKFNHLLNWAQAHGMEYVVTGHYARVEQDPDTGRWLLKKGLDEGKDQSYVLYNLTQQQLAHVRLPLGAPVYVCGKDMQANTVTVGPESALFDRIVYAEDVNWIAIPELTGPLRVTARTRYHQTEQAATVYPAENGFRLEFDQPQRAPTPGQSVVLYQGDVVLGGGIITRVEK